MKLIVLLLLATGIGFLMGRNRSGSPQNRGEAAVKNALQSNFNSPDYHLLNKDYRGWTSCRREPFRSPPFPRSAPFPVDPVEIKSLRIKHAANPADRVLVLFVLAVTENFEEQRIAVRAAHVFRRTGVLTRKARRQRQIDARPVRWRRLDDDTVSPAVATTPLGIGHVQSRASPATVPARGSHAGP